MLKLPEFTEQAMYDAETFFHLSMTVDRLAKFVVHYEAFKMVQDVPGAIVECGVFKGTSFMRFALMRELLGNYFSTKLVGFDIFNDEYPETAFEEDRAQREHWLQTAGGTSISVDQLSDLFQKKNIRNFQLIQGNVLQTVPSFMRANPGFKVALLNVDIDFAEPTFCVLEHFYDCMPKGGVILLDNYAGEGSSGLTLHGDNKGVDDFFAGKNVRIRRFPFAARPCYVIKD